MSPSIHNTASVRIAVQSVAGRTSHAAAMEQFLGRLKGAVRCSRGLDVSQCLHDVRVVAKSLDAYGGSREYVIKYLASVLRSVVLSAVAIQAHDGYIHVFGHAVAVVRIPFAWFGGHISRSMFAKVRPGPQWQGTQFVGNKAAAKIVNVYRVGIVACLAEHLVGCVWGHRRLWSCLCDALETCKDLQRDNVAQEGLWAIRRVAHHGNAPPRVPPYLLRMPCLETLARHIWSTPWNEHRLPAATQRTESVLEGTALAVPALLARSRCALDAWQGTHPWSCTSMDFMRSVHGPALPGEPPTTHWTLQQQRALFQRMHSNMLVLPFQAVLPRVARGSRLVAWEGRAARLRQFCATSLRACAQKVGISLSTPEEQVVALTAPWCMQYGATAHLCTPLGRSNPRTTQRIAAALCLDVLLRAEYVCRAGATTNTTEPCTRWLEAIEACVGVEGRGGPHLDGPGVWRHWHATPCAWIQRHDASTMDVCPRWVFRRIAHIQTLLCTARDASLASVLLAHNSILRRCARRLVSDSTAPQWSLHITREEAHPTAVLEFARAQGFSWHHTRELGAFVVPSEALQGIYCAAVVASQWCRAIRPRGWTRVVLGTSSPRTSFVVAPRDEMEAFRLVGIVVGAVLSSSLETVGHLVQPHTRVLPAPLAPLVAHAVSWKKGMCVFAALWAAHCLWVSRPTTTPPLLEVVLGPSTPFFWPHGNASSQDVDTWRTTLTSLLTNPALPLTRGVLDSLARIRVMHRCAVDALRPLLRHAPPALRASRIRAARMRPLAALVADGHGRGPHASVKLRPGETRLVWELVCACMAIPETTAAAHDAHCAAAAVATSLVCWDWKEANTKEDPSTNTGPCPSPPRSWASLEQRYARYAVKRPSTAVQGAQWHSSGIPIAVQTDGGNRTWTVCHRDVVPVVLNPPPLPLLRVVTRTPTLGSLVCLGASP